MSSELEFLPASAGLSFHVTCVCPLGVEPDHAIPLLTAYRQQSSSKGGVNIKESDHVKC
jgi:hypothetical protein